MVQRSSNEFTILASSEAPVPFRVIGVPEEMTTHDRIGDLFGFVAAHGVPGSRGDTWPEFRCVGIDRLPTVLRTGIDVEPSTAPIYTDRSPGKAWEYGEFPKVMLLLDSRALAPTWREVSASLDPSELAELRLTYPTLLPSRDGATIWLSRLGEDDRNLASAYEIEHGRWIPGDARSALMGILIFVRPSEATAVLSLLEQGH